LVLLVFPVLFAALMLNVAPGQSQKKEHKKEHGDIPKKELKALFPDVTSFTARACKPNKDQQAAIEQQVGLKLRDKELHTKCVVALQKTPEGKTSSVGVAWFTHVEGAKGELEYGVAMDPGGKILRVAVYENPESKALGEKEFLKQFEGKSPDDPFKVGQDVKAANGDDRGSQLLATGVRKAALVMKAAFFEKK
jgi:Na+-translocating ferredoxin:NAD+ oxidoreductase RnfG subunit